jgi:hypothetical protein
MFGTVGRATVPAETGRHGGRPYDSTRAKFLFRFDWTLAASGDACMKLHEFRCHFQEESHHRARGDRRDYLKFFFSAVSHRGVGHRTYGFRLVESRAYSSERPEAANSAVNYYVSCSIRPAVFLAGNWADTRHLYPWE